MCEIYKYLHVLMNEYLNIKTIKTLPFHIVCFISFLVLNANLDTIIILGNPVKINIFNVMSTQFSVIHLPVNFSHFQFII